MIRIVPLEVAQISNLCLSAQNSSLTINWRKNRDDEATSIVPLHVHMVFNQNNTDLENLIWWNAAKDLSQKF